MKLSEETRKKHRWLLKELTAISRELEEMEEKDAQVSDPPVAVEKPKEE